MKRFLIAALLLVSFVALPSFAADRKKPMQGTPAARLLELASRSTTIEVIVGVELDEEWTPDGRLSPARKNRQRAHIKEKKEELLRRHLGAELQMRRDYASIPYFVAEVDAHALRKLLDDVHVTSIEENRQGRLALAESTPKIGATAAHARGYRGGGEFIVILDSGVDHDHPFLVGRVVEADEACFSGLDGRAESVCPNAETTQFGAGAGAPCTFDDVGKTCEHGTHVAGIAAGRDSYLGFNGVAPDAWIIPIQVMSWEKCNTQHGCGTGVKEADVLSALEYVNGTLLDRHPVAAVNMSFVLWLPPSREDCNRLSPSLADVISSLRSNNVAVVAGAGNDADQQPGTYGRLGSPACITGAISVGATKDNDEVANYSNTATYLDFFAPGGTAFTEHMMIKSSIPGGGYAEKHGTSMATPHVSGAFAVLRGRSPLASIDKLQSDLVQSGFPVTDTRLNPPIVKPRINVDAALDLADVHPPTDPASFTASGTSSGAVTLTWTASTDDAGVDHYELLRRDRYDIHWSFLADATNSPYIDSASPSKMYEYSIVAVDTSGLRSGLQYDYAVNVTFTDDPVSANTTAVYGRHMAELREATDAWREFANLPRIFTYTSEIDSIRASHFTGVVDAMNAARLQMSLPPFAYTSVPAPDIGVAIRTAHVQELRTAAR